MSELVKDVANLIDIGSINGILHFLESIEKKKNIELMMENTESLINAKKVRYELKSKVVNTLSYDKYSKEILEEIQEKLKKVVGEIEQIAIEKEKARKRMRCVLGDIAEDNHSIAYILKRELKKGDKSELPYALFIYCKNVLTEHLMLKTVNIEPPKVVKKKRFIFF